VGGGFPLPTGEGETFFHAGLPNVFFFQMPFGLPNVWGGSCAPSPEKFLTFGLPNVHFWCILSDIFRVWLCVLHAKQTVFKK